MAGPVEERPAVPGHVDPASIPEGVDRQTGGIGRLRSTNRSGGPKGPGGIERRDWSWSPVGTRRRRRGRRGTRGRFRRVVGRVAVADGGTRHRRGSRMRSIPRQSSAGLSRGSSSSSRTRCGRSTRGFLRPPRIDRAETPPRRRGARDRGGPSRRTGRGARRSRRRGGGRRRGSGTRRGPGTIRGTRRRSRERR